MLGLTSSLLSSVPGVSHRFLQRIGGTSPAPWRALNTSHDVGDVNARVDENLARVRFQIGVPRSALYSVTQVHGREVVRVLSGDDVDEVRARKADALITVARNTALGIRTADCAPILFAVDDGSAVAAAHAGWRGAVGGIIEGTIAALCESARVEPKRIVAAVGPCIGMGAFEVGPEVVTAAARALDVDESALASRGLVRAGNPAHSEDASKSHMDLAGLCRAVLLKSGVERVDVVVGDTYVDDERYFSHRRDVTHRGQKDTGRQMSAIARAEPPKLDDESLR